jgi:predicted RNA binding protein YcfA (HicA-like mRNA interferase family)
MPRLPVITAKKVIDFLLNQGFSVDHATGSHLIFYNPTNKSRAVVPRHNKDLPKGTLLSILKESGFAKEDIVKYFSHD